MSLCRAILCVICPPLAVLDKGCGCVILVALLWVIGIFPGIIAAFMINLIDQPEFEPKPSDPGQYQRKKHDDDDDVIDIEAKEL